MKQWFIQIENKVNHTRITIYENGLVYGPEKGQKLYILKEETMEKIKVIINSQSHITKGQANGYYNYKRNSLLLRINTNTRKYKQVKIVGWDNIEEILDIIKDSNNHIKEF